MHWRIADIKDFSEEEFKNAMILASNSRKQHFARFKRSEAIKQSLAGEILIKRILDEDFNIKAVIECDEKGKPYIKNQNVYISISHSNDLVFCAASYEKIGVDIEKMSPINLGVAKKFSNESELEYIGSDLKRFYEIWTAKEAYYKMVGERAVNFKSFSVFNLNRKTVLDEEYYAQIATL